MLLPRNRSQGSCKFRAWMRDASPEQSQKALDHLRSCAYRLRGRGKGLLGLTDKLQGGLDLAALAAGGRDELPLRARGGTRRAMSSWQGCCDDDLTLIVVEHCVDTIDSQPGGRDVRWPLDVDLLACAHVLTCRGTRHDIRERGRGIAWNKNTRSFTARAAAGWPNLDWSGALVWPAPTCSAGLR